MNKPDDPLPIAFFSEMLAADQMLRSRIARALPKGMELSHLSVLNHLSRARDERTPAQLARMFYVTRGAMTNTLARLERAGHIHIRPDWNDARQKFVAISPAGRAARDAAISAVAPVLADAVAEIGSDRVRGAVQVMRDMRQRLETEFRTLGSD
ncbi:MAG: MarR family transcriptional regulator [Pseudomonadota bacterium]